jgi:hypothetical protein
MVIRRFLLILAFLVILGSGARAQGHMGLPSVVAPGASGAVTSPGIPPVTPSPSPSITPFAPLPNPGAPAAPLPAAPVMNVPTCVAPGYVGPSGTPNGCLPGTPAHPYSLGPNR